MRERSRAAHCVSESLPAVAIHGKGLTHGFWLPPGSVVIEIFPPATGSRDFNWIASMVGAAYVGLSADVVYTPSTLGVRGDINSVEIPLPVHLEPVLATLRAWLHPYGLEVHGTPGVRPSIMSSTMASPSCPPMPGPCPPIPEPCPALACPEAPACNCAQPPPFLVSHQSAAFRDHVISTYAPQPFYHAWMPVAAGVLGGAISAVLVLRFGRRRWC